MPILHSSLMAPGRRRVELTELAPHKDSVNSREEFLSFMREFIRPLCQAFETCHLENSDAHNELMLTVPFTHSPSERVTLNNSLAAYSEIFSRQAREVTMNFTHYGYIRDYFLCAGDTQWLAFEWQNHLDTERVLTLMVSTDWEDGWDWEGREGREYYSAYVYFQYGQ